MGDALLIQAHWLENNLRLISSLKDIWGSILLRVIRELYAGY